jgi:hypothetical protein
MSGIESITAKWESWQRDCSLFVREVIGAEPTKQQLEFFKVVVEMQWAKIKASLKQEMSKREYELSRKKGIAIKSGHGTGKDFALACMYWWGLSCWKEFRGMVTAPTAHQLENIFWGELGKWLKNSTNHFKKLHGPEAVSFLEEYFVYQSDKIFYKEHKRGKDPTWILEARTANIKASEDEQGETLAGRHANYMILAIDEASGVPRGIFKPIEGAMTGPCNFAVLIGNPTRESGYFYDCFNSQKKWWEMLTWSSEDCERIPKHLLEREQEEHGRNSNWYRIRRLGEFPISGSDNLIPLSWAVRAAENELINPPDSMKVKGIDIGHGQDPSVICTRVGNKIIDFAEYNSDDTMKVVAWVMEELSDDNDYTYAFIDPIGIGAGVYDRLRELQVPRLIPVDMREESSDIKCFRKRDELLWKTRTVFETGTIQIPYDEDFIQEISDIKWEQPDTTKGLIKIESKKDMRKRGVRSPNKLDTLAMTYYFKDNTVKATTKTFIKPKQMAGSTSWKTI